MRRSISLAFVSVFAVGSLAIAARPSEAQPLPPAINPQTLPSITLPHELTAAEIAAQHAQLRATAEAWAKRAGTPIPPPPPTGADPWATPVVLTPSQMVDAKTGSFLDFRNAASVTGKYGTPPQAVAFLTAIPDFPYDQQLHTWTPVGADQSGVRITLGNMPVNHLIAIDCTVKFASGAGPMGLVLYANNRQSLTVVNDHAVTAFIATTPGLMMGFAQTGCTGTPGSGTCSNWAFLGCTFTAI